MVVRKEPAVLLANAIVWGVVMIASSLALKGTGSFEKIQGILGGGAAASFLLVAVGVLRRPRA